MQKTTFLIILLSFFYHTNAQNCDKAFSAANYSVAHTNKAYESNNTEHVREWTEKAMETFTEVEEITSECGCTEVSNLAYSGFEACDKAQVENTYERARFFAKRAREKAKAMIVALSKCTNKSVDEISNRSGSVGSSSSTSNSDDEYEADDNDLNSQQKELLAQQEELLEQQRLLKEKIEAQQKQVAQIKQQRANELTQQKRIKVSAEIALAEIQKNYEKLANSIGCSKALKVARISFARTADALEKETLRDTKTYYTDKLSEIVDKFNLHFSECANEW